MFSRYFKHLTDVIRNNANEAFELCKEVKDIEKAQALESLFYKYGEEAAELIKFITIQESEGSDGEPYKTSVSRSPYEEATGHSAKFNVDAPCFVPLWSTDDESGHSYRGYPSQWAELSEARHHVSHIWPAQHVVHAQFPFPHHYHVPAHHSQPLLYSGSSLPVFPHYSGPPIPVLPPSQNGLSDDHSKKKQYHSLKHIKSKEFKNEIPRPTRKILNTENKLDVPLPNYGDTLPEPNVAEIIDSSCIEGRAEAVKDLTLSNIKVPQPLKKESIDESVFASPEQLREFPALSSDPPVKKPKPRFPPVKYQRKMKLTLADLYKRFGSPELEENPLSRRNRKNLSSEYQYKRNKMPIAAVLGEDRCLCIEKVNVFRRGRALYEKVPEEISDEADGWKKVKPRFSKNKDNEKQIRMKENLLGVYPCKVCHTTHRRRYETSNRKHVNVRRNSQFTSNKYGSARNNCTRDAIPTHVLGLHYNNVLVPSHITPKCSKLNNEVSSVASKNDRVRFVDSKLMSNASGTISEQVLNVVSKNHTLAPSYVDSNYMDELNNENHDLVNVVCDNSVGTNTILLSPFLDEDFSLQNNFPTVSTTVSSNSIVDNEDECNIDRHNMDLSGEMSIDDDNPVNDTMPVVEDAHDMHEEFMKYLNCSTWPTQMDEIDKFESMIAGNNPSDPVLMYPSVSVEQFTEFIQRHPDEAQVFRREITFKLRKIRETETKQQQAYEKRLELLKSKTDKVRGFVQKVKDVQLAQDKLALKRKHQIDEKLRKAEENRKNYLSIIRRKAHDEEEKLKEIAFINELEAQNRRHDSLALRQEHQERLQAISDERQRRVEEKAAKEAAAEERRRVLEADRQERLQRMAEARRKKEETIDRKNQAREKERLETAREKQREREERLLARRSLQRATAEELQKRIMQKQEDSARRHEENIESIRQRALEVGLHRNVEDTTNISPVAKTEEPVAMEIEVAQDTPETAKLKLQRKKRMRKIKLRLVSRGSEFLETYPSSSSSVSALGKHIVELKSDLPLESAIIIVNSIKDVLRKSSETEETPFETLAQSRGLVPLTAIIKGYISKAAYSLSCQDFQLIYVIMDVFKLFIVQGGDSCSRYFICSNDVILAIDLLKFSFGGSKLNEKFTKLFGSALDLLIISLNTMSSMDSEDKINNNRIADICSYIANSGAIERVIAMCKEMVIEEDSDRSVNIFPNCIDFFGALVNPRFKSGELSNLLLTTECFGTVPLLYEGLQRIAVTDELPFYIRPIVEFYRKFSALDIIRFQDALGDDSMALQTRAIASNLLNYSKAKPNSDLLHAIILLVGYFAMRNHKNQTLLQSGQQPTVLQQLVNLPFIYFCDRRYTEILFPTLYVCSFNNPTNKAIVENDMNFSQLESYIFSDRGIENPLMKVFYELDER